MQSNDLGASGFLCVSMKPGVFVLNSPVVKKLYIHSFCMSFPIVQIKLVNGLQSVCIHVLFAVSNWVIFFIKLIVGFGKDENFSLCVLLMLL